MLLFRKHVRRTNHVSCIDSYPLMEEQGRVTRDDRGIRIGWEEKRSCGDKGPMSPGNSPHSTDTLPSLNLVSIIL